MLMVAVTATAVAVMMVVMVAAAKGAYPICAATKRFLGGMPGGRRVIFDLIGWHFGHSPIYFTCLHQSKRYSCNDPDIGLDNSRVRRVLYSTRSLAVAVSRSARWAFLLQYSSDLFILSDFPVLPFCLTIPSSCPVRLVPRSVSPTYSSVLSVLSLCPIPSYPSVLLFCPVPQLGT